MAVLKMERKAGDNEYLHKDFHIALNIALKYLHEKYSKEMVNEFLRDFANSYHKPLKEEITKKGLLPLKKYFENIYNKEKAAIDIKYSDNKMNVLIEKCPAIEHIIKNNEKPYEYYEKTTTVVFEEVMEKTGYEFRLLKYEKDTGKAELEFSKEVKI